MSKEKAITKRFELFKSNKKVYYIIVAVLVVVLFVMMMSGFIEKKDADTYDSVTAYVNSMEEKLTSLLSKVEGVGKVSVAINVESGMETVLASKVTTTEKADGKETVETPILLNGKTVVLKEVYPKISGVLIVAQGASSITVLRRIQQATVSLLDIDVNRVEILTMK